MWRMTRTPSDLFLLRKYAWRAIAENICDSYAVGSRHIWWGFSSCSTDKNMAMEFLKDAQEKTLFQIYFKVGYDISHLSAFPKEKEVLLPPARYLQVCLFVSCILLFQFRLTLILGRTSIAWRWFGFAHDHIKGDKSTSSTYWLYSSKCKLGFVKHFFGTNNKTKTKTDSHKQDRRKRNHSAPSPDTSFIPESVGKSKLYCFYGCWRVFCPEQ